MKVMFIHGVLSNKRAYGTNRQKILDRWCSDKDQWIDGYWAEPYGARIGEREFPEVDALALDGNVRHGLVDIAQRSLTSHLSLLQPYLIDFFADLMCYLSNSEVILSELSRRLNAELRDHDQLVIIGHSLGGIIAGELVTSTYIPLKDIRVLTFGTLLGEVAKRQCLKHFAPLTPMNSFRWLNLHDPVDLLSAPIKYCKCSNEVNNQRQGFPQCHSSYPDDEVFVKPVRNFLGVG